MAINSVINSVINKAPAMQNVQKAPKLSINAQNYLAYLESKFTDVTFFVGSARYSSGIRDFDSDAVYNCFLCPDLIERMANDPETAAKYEQIIWEMRAQMDNLHYGLKESGLGEYVATYAVEINDDGSVDYVVMLKDSTRGLHGKEDENKSALPKTIKAKSVDELFKVINNITGKSGDINSPEGILA
jgi:hypothetical protein